MHECFGGALGSFGSLAEVPERAAWVRLVLARVVRTTFWLGLRERRSIKPILSSGGIIGPGSAAPR